MRLIILTAAAVAAIEAVAALFFGGDDIVRTALPCTLIALSLYGYARRRYPKGSRA